MLYSPRLRSLNVVFPLRESRAIHTNVTTTAKHVNEMTASRCSTEKKGPSCARTEVEHNKATKKIIDLIKVPSVGSVVRVKRHNNAQRCCWL